MLKNIQTQNADLNLVKKFLDYANCADASYAMLHYVNYVKKDSEDKNEQGDKQTLGYKFNNQNSTYARAIEARFNEDKIGDWCIPFIDKCLTTKPRISDNDITQVGLYDKLSDRTINFTSRFKLLHHQPNTTSGFSATLFEDLGELDKELDNKTNTRKKLEKDKQYILAIRGTEFPLGIFNDIAEADVSLALNSLSNHQYIDMLKFYCECVDKYPSLHKDNNLIIVGHSLGGALAQMLTLSLATPNSKGNIKEVYTFNSPGAKNLKPLNLDNVYEIDSTILSDANKDNKEKVLFKKIRDYEYNENSNLLKDAILINYDSGLLNTINKYFSNNENLKEHSIFLRTFTSTRLMPLWYGGALSNATYSYEIIKINEIFMKCITNLKDNYQLQKPLACKDNIHHIEADNDSNPNNNKLIDNLIQDLGVDIDGKHYFINVGEFWKSHYLAPSINELQRVLMYLQSGNINNLLEYNIIKEKDKSLFLRNREAKNAQQILNTQSIPFNLPLSHNNLFLNPIPPKPSKELQETIAYLNEYMPPQKPKDILKEKGERNNKECDKQTLGDKFNNQNSTYARAIEARFEEAMIINV